MKKYFHLFIVSTLFQFSCSNKLSCDIKPIAENVLDTIKMKGDFVFKSKGGNLDTIVLLDNYNVIRQHTVKGLLNYKECGHMIGFDYVFNSKNGTISVELKKDNNSEYFFSINGFCVNKEIKLSQKEVEKDSIIIVDIDKCDESEFKKLAFRKFRLEYFITQNGDIWKPVKFIPDRADIP